MSITGAIVSFWIIWFITLLCVLPAMGRSQEQTGEIAPGTPASAPVKMRPLWTLIWTTLIALLLWAGLYGLVSSGWLTLDRLDWFYDGEALKRSLTSG